MSMTRTHTKTYTTPVLEEVSAHLIKEGDIVLVPRMGDSGTLQRVQQVNGVGGKHAPNARVWPAIHIMLSDYGIVRFPHEPVTRLVTEDSGDDGDVGVRRSVRPNDGGSKYYLVSVRVSESELRFMANAECPSVTYKLKQLAKETFVKMFTGP